MSTSDLPDDHVGLEIVVAHIIQEFMRYMKQSGLSMPQVHALMYIYHSGECQVSDLGALADVSSAAASQLAERLVVQGLVDRREDPINRRSKILKLSEKGKGLILGSLPSIPFLAEIMASLTPDQRVTVHEAVSILAQATRQRHDLNKPKED